MADEIRQPQPPDYSYGLYKAVPGTRGLPGFPDTFYGPRDKAYADFLARDKTRIRGTNGFYYVKDDQNRRIDGDKPLSSPPTPPTGDLLRRREHAGMALYGEQVIVKEQVDSVTREVQPDWAYLDPILVRGIVTETSFENDPDERGAIYVRRCTYDLARVLCEQEWKFQPQPGDLVNLPFLLGTLSNQVKGGYFDVEDVSRDESRFGGTGFFVAYRLTLWRSSKFEPQRKLPPRKITTEDDVQENTPT
jgi:hypothetical protein